MIIKQFTAGQLENNMYLVMDEHTKKAVLIDASALIPEITDTVRALGADVEYILLTHGHFDHIMGLNDLKKALDSKAVICKDDLIISDNINEFTWEPVCISMEDNHHYTPDCLINDTLIELKPREHLKYTGDSVDNRFEKEVQAANNYCKENNLHFKVIYDDELDFKSKKFKKFLLDNPEIVEKYNIRFKKELNRD